MKKQVTISSIWLLAIIFCVQATAGAQWANVGPANFSTNYPGGASIAIDGSGTPYVAYSDNGSSGRATVMKYNGSTWTAVGGAAFTAADINFPSLAIDGNDTLYLAYSDGNNSNKATVMKYNGSSWVTVGTAGFSAGTAQYISLAIDGNDTLYVAYRDGSNSNKATVMKYNGSSWVTVGTAGFSAAAATYTSLAIDGNDTLYAGYMDGGNSNKATVMKYNGSSWVTVGTAGFSASSAPYTDLAIDGSGAPYVVYQDGSVSAKATVMKYSGSSWAAVGTVGFSTGQAYQPTLAIDGNDSLYVAYSDAGVSYGSTVKKYNGSNWVTVGIAGFSPGSAFTNLIAIDGAGTPYVAFLDDNNDEQITVMNYPPITNTWNGTTWSLGTPDSTHQALISSNTAPTSFSCNNLTISSGFSLNTGTSDVVTIYGDLTNEGSGVTGTGTLVFTKNGTTTLAGNTIAHVGTVLVETGCTLATANKLRLLSNDTATGRIGESAGTITGNVVVQRYQPGKRCFRFYGHPFSTSIALNQLTDSIDITGNGGAANGFTTTTSNNPSAFWFDVAAADTSTTGANPGWVAFTSANTASWDRYELLRLLVRGEKGQGLASGTYTPSASTFEAAGLLNQGTQTITLTKGTNTNFAGSGNPFPSGIQMQDVAVGTNVGANYYVWDATSGAAGAYVTNAWTLSYILPSYAAFFTTVSATDDITIEEADKSAGGVALFKGTAGTNWVELLISDSSIKWDRLLINLDDNAMDVEDNMDGKKLYNPGLDFFTLSKDDVRLAVDVRPYADGAAIPLGLTAYDRYNKYVIKTGMFDVPAGTKLFLHDKYLNKTQELATGVEYWFDVTTDSLSQGNQRFEINMVGKPTSIIAATSHTAKMQLIPNPAQNEVKVSFDKLDGAANIKLMTVTGQVIFTQTVQAATGSVAIPLQNIPNGVYIIELQSNNARFSEQLIKQ